MNNFLLEGDYESIEKERKRIIEEANFLEAIVNFYDIEEVPLENALEDLYTYGFLSEEKVIVIQNIEVLKYEEAKKSVDHLLNYLKQPLTNQLLIIEAKKLNNTSKITKELKKYCDYILVEIDSKQYIKDCFKGFQIDSSTISFLQECCQNDFSKIKNECEKLKNYRWEEKKITKSDIEELVPPKLGDAKELTFAFSKDLAMREKKNALKKYQELLSYQIEPLSIIGLLASQLRIIYQVKLLEKKQLTSREIAQILEEKSEYRITKTRELTKFYSEEELLNYMISLAKIDYQIKTEDVDGNHLIELFILSI